MKIVVDSNIVFSAILNTESNIGQLIIQGTKYFEFYSVGLLKEEILKHRVKILKSSNYSNDQFQNIFQLIINNIQFINDVILSDNEIADALELVKDIDENDTLFIALSDHLESKLWTGDKNC